jgi:transposase
MSKEHAATPSLAELTAEVVRLRALAVEQSALIKQQAERIAELEARLAKDSHNSSKPPWSDPPFRKPPPRSQRKASGRKPGGQPGHQGATRTLVDEPERLVVMALEGACPCGRCRSQIEVGLWAERRQVVELVIRREVTAYRIVAGTCACGRWHRSDFPQDVSAPGQYGPGVSACAVYMTQYPLLPWERTAAVLDELAGIAISPGSIYSAVHTAAAHVPAPVTAIREALVGAPLAHADETGMRVGRALHWLHVLCTAPLTAYFPPAKRGGAAIAAWGLLPRFAGVLVHEHCKPDALLPCQHAYCNAHHRRELTAIAETIPSQRPWAEDMIALLCEANTLTGEARAAGFAALPGPMVLDIHSRYDTILDVAKVRNPAREPKPGSRVGGCATVQPTTWSNASARTATRCCASLPTFVSPSITTRPSATCACPSSSKRSPAASAPITASPPSPTSAPTSPPCESSQPTSSNRWF